MRSAITTQFQPTGSHRLLSLGASGANVTQRGESGWEVEGGGGGGGTATPNAVEVECLSTCITIRCEPRNSLRLELRDSLRALGFKANCCYVGTDDLEIKNMYCHQNLAYRTQLLVSVLTRFAH